MTYNFNPSISAFGGILTAWNPNHLSLTSSSTSAHTLTSTFQSTANCSTFIVMNCYGPCAHQDKQAFLDELTSLSSSISGAWIVLGDFNLVRSPGERSNDNFDIHEADWFNSMIDDLALLEVPLLDRRFTWSNHQ